MKLSKKQTAIAIGVVACFLLTLVLLGSGAVQSAYSLIQNSGSPLARRTTLNFTGAGVSCADASPVTTCTVSGGGGGATAGAGVTVFSGVTTLTGTTVYYPIGGGTGNGLAESAVQVSSPTAATISNFSVVVSSAPGMGNSLIFTWRDNGSSLALTCTISGAVSTSCTDNTHTATLSQGDLVDIQVAQTGISSYTAVLNIATAFGTVATNNPAFTISNAGSTGTTVNTLTKLTGAPSTAVITATTDTGGAIGITTAGAGTTGTATVTTAGKISCVFDGATTAGDYVQISATTAGNCHDTTAATYPTSGQVLGRVLSTNGGAGTYTIDLFPSEIKAASGGGGGLSVSGYYIFDGTSYYTQFPGLIPVVRPSTLSFSWLTTQGTASVATTRSAITLTAPATSGDAVRLYGHAINSFTTLTVLYDVASGLLQNFNSTGIALYESGTGKIVTYQTSLFAGAPVGAQLFVSHWNSSTSFGSNVFSTNQSSLSTGPLWWVRVQLSGGNILFSVSGDGQNFQQLYSEAQTSGFTTAPDNWGIVANANNSGGSQTVTNTYLAFDEQ